VACDLKKASRKLGGDLEPRPRMIDSRNPRSQNSPASRTSDDRHGVDAARAPPRPRCACAGLTLPLPPSCSTVAFYFRRLRMGTTLSGGGDPYQTTLVWKA